MSLKRRRRRFYPEFYTDEEIKLQNKEYDKNMNDTDYADYKEEGTVDTENTENLVNIENMENMENEDYNVTINKDHEEANLKPPILSSFSHSNNLQKSPDLYDLPNLLDDSPKNSVLPEKIKEKETEMERPKKTINYNDLLYPNNTNASAISKQLDNMQKDFIEKKLNTEKSQNYDIYDMTSNDYNGDNEYNEYNDLSKTIDKTETIIDLPKVSSRINNNNNNNEVKTINSSGNSNEISIEIPDSMYYYKDMAITQIRERQDAFEPMTDTNIPTVPVFEHLEKFEKSETPDNLINEFPLEPSEPTKTTAQKNINFGENIDNSMNNINNDEIDINNFNDFDDFMKFEAETTNKYDYSEKHDQEQIQEQVTEHIGQTEQIDQIAKIEPQKETKENERIEYIEKVEEPNFFSDSNNLNYSKYLSNPNFIPFDKENAIKYAHRWAFDRNPNFLNFENIGGDCTNYVSQILLAGGCKMDMTPVLGWYYNNSNDKSPSWTGVEQFYNYITKDKNFGIIGKEIDLDEVEAGDIAQLSFNGRTYQHTPFIVEVMRNPNDANDEGNNENNKLGYEDIKICAHSFDSENRILNTYKWRKIRFIRILGYTED